MRYNFFPNDINFLVLEAISIFYYSIFRFLKNLLELIDVVKFLKFHYKEFEKRDTIFSQVELFRFSDCLEFFYYSTFRPFKNLLELSKFFKFLGISLQKIQRARCNFFSK